MRKVERTRSFADGHSLNLFGFHGWSVLLRPNDSNKLSSGIRKRLASTAVAGGPVKLWDAQTDQELLSLPVGADARSVAFSPDGHRLAAGTAGGTVTIWDATPVPEKS
jgi:WD40 repeat protein